MEFSEKIKQLRLGRRLSQDEVAKIIGISRPTYSLVEGGLKDLTLEQLRNISQLFGVPLDDFISLENKSANPDRAALEERVFVYLNSIKHQFPGDAAMIWTLSNGLVSEVIEPETAAAYAKGKDQAIKDMLSDVTYLHEAIDHIIKSRVEGLPKNDLQKVAEQVIKGTLKGDNDATKPR